MVMSGIVENLVSYLHEKFAEEVESFSADRTPLDVSSEVPLFQVSRVCGCELFAKRRDSKLLAKHVVHYVYLNEFPVSAKSFEIRITPEFPCPSRSGRGGNNSSGFKVERLRCLKRVLG